MSIDDAMQLYEGQIIWKGDERLKVNAPYASDGSFLQVIDDYGITYEYDIGSLELYNWKD